MKLPEAFLNPNSEEVIRASGRLRAFRLREAGAVALRKQAYRVHSRTHIRSVIYWLNVDRAKRYLPEHGSTFCNVYVCDVADLCGIYLPRVWWTHDAINQLKAGALIEPRYSSNVVELSTNSIAVWLHEHGHTFGWIRASTLDELQERANTGRLCLIVARAAHPSTHGHISVVVSERACQSALRAGSRVLCPVQSQAGKNPTKLGRASRWWEGPQFQAAELWFAALPSYGRNHPQAGQASSEHHRHRGIHAMAAWLVRMAFPEVTFTIASVVEATIRHSSGTPSPFLIDALVAAEDRRFFSHFGFDVWGIARALWCCARYSQLQGASTLEQQLVRTITGRRQLTLRRKVSEICLAAWLSYNFQKSEIAAGYLRLAYFGWHMNGLSQAADRLEIDLDKVSLQQACDVVAALRYPLARAPGRVALERWRRRSQYIQKLLQAKGKKHGRTAATVSMGRAVKRSISAHRIRGAHIIPPAR